MKRRNFLKQSALATLVPLVPKFLHPFDAGKLAGEKILVVVQLSGGNDGLNTLVPYRNDIYYKNRPTIAIPAKNILRVNDSQGFHPALTEFKSLYDQGQLAIVNNVGYDHPVRSHFRAMDIWNSGSSASEVVSTGWLGRYLDTSCAGCERDAHALSMDADLPLALKGARRSGFATGDLRQLYEVSRTPRFQAMIKAQHDQEHESLGFMYKSLTKTVSTADYLYETSGKVKSRQLFPTGQLGIQLRRASELIAAGCYAKVYYTDLPGFDSHTGQLELQNRLLTELSLSVGAFVKDMKALGRMDDILMVVFSEFGRRVAENGSGTDHGNANQVYLIGGKLPHAGMFNAVPDLGKLDEIGDLIHTVDFRQVYQEVLNSWLGVNAASVLNGKFPDLGILKA